MKRQVDMNEISDGKKYSANDLVKTDCGGCVDCHKCCTGMGESIVLTPYDVYEMSCALNQNFSELLETYLELHVVDYVLLPNLKMAGPREQCSFLNDEGRCSIHAHRPGICRLFPLGRAYEGDGFYYFLQVHECPKEPKTKIKVKKWLGISDLKSYEDFILLWHDFLQMAEQVMVNADEATVKNLNLLILQSFYGKAYDTQQSFYEQFESRWQQLIDIIKSL